MIKDAVKDKDGNPLRVCPACAPSDDCTAHKHWLLLTPGATHTSDCKHYEKGDE